MIVAGAVGAVGSWNCVWDAATRLHFIDAGKKLERVDDLMEPYQCISKSFYNK